jgi:RimJ/RimL family protein N-acetyltransferase
VVERTRFTGDAEPLVDTDPLTGRLVRLRELREEDLPQLVAWWNDPGIATYQALSPQPRSYHGVADMFRAWCRNDTGECGLCVTKRKGGELIGQVALFGATSKDRCATFAIVLGSEHHDRGYGTDAVRLMVRYGFAELGLHRIELSVYGFNQRAMATYRKAGFVEEGRRRQSIWRSGRWHDHVTMGILYEEWAEAGRTR